MWIKNLYTTYFATYFVHTLLEYYVRVSQDGGVSVRKGEITGRFLNNICVWTSENTRDPLAECPKVKEKNREVPSLGALDLKSLAINA